jgi:hypothetical protein
MLDDTSSETGTHEVDTEREENNKKEIWSMWKEKEKISHKDEIFKWNINKYFI